MALGLYELTKRLARHIDVPKQFAARCIPCPNTTFEGRNMAIAQCNQALCSQLGKTFALINGHNRHITPG